MTRIKTLFLAPALLLALAVGLVGCNDQQQDTADAAVQAGAKAVNFTYNTFSLAQSIKPFDRDWPRIERMADIPPGLLP